MKKYIQESIDLFDEDVSTKVSSAANKNLHKVNPETPILSKNQAEDFYSIVAKILWTTKQAQPYIETIVAFIFTRVKSPMEQGKKNSRDCYS